MSSDKFFNLSFYFLFLVLKFCTSKTLTVFSSFDSSMDMNVSYYRLYDTCITVIIYRIFNLRLMKCLLVFCLAGTKGFESDRDSSKYIKLGICV